MKTGGFWDFKLYQEKEWFHFLAWSLILLTILYILLHAFISKNAGYEYSKLDEKQIQQINRIYFDSTNVLKDTSTKKTTLLKNEKKGNKPSVSDSNNLTTDTKKDKGLSADSAKTGVDLVIKNNQPDTCTCVNKIKCERVIEYLKNEFSRKMDSSQINYFHNYLCSSMPLEATSFLSNIRLRVRSYFWLTGPEVYMEIVLWTLFGVLSSLLFNLGVIGKNSTTDPKDRSTYFDASEIPNQVAKLLYAPFCTIVIILGYNFFNNQNIVDISSSKGVIVFSFIGGFYSSRMISLLDRLKDVLFPNSGTASTPVIKNQAPLKNILIELQTNPDNNILPNQLATESSIVLQNTVTKEQFNAVNINDNLTPLFIADYIKPGNYTITATYPKGDVQLTGTQKIEMKTSDIFIIIKLDAAH